LRDPALERASFKRQLKTFLFARYRQRIERIRDAMTMRYMKMFIHHEGIDTRNTAQDRQT